MPTIQRYRVWCKKCDNFELHDRDIETKDLTCRTCETLYSEILLGDIPSEKLLEQRARYRASHKGQFNTYLEMISESPEQRRMKEMMHMFSTPGSDIEIHESDAGQKELDRIIAEERAIEREEKRKIKEEQKIEAAKYSSLGRNDTCICGSGIKYKKCCLDKIRSYRI